MLEDYSVKTYRLEGHGKIGLLVKVRWKAARVCKEEKCSVLFH